MFTNNAPATHNDSLVLLSGGMDSAVVLALAKVNTCETVRTISFDYGQRHKKELKAANELSQYYMTRHREFYISSYLIGTLDDPSPGYRHYEHLDKKYLPKGDVPLLPRTWVPCRNILFLTVASYNAWWNGTHILGLGVHQEDQPGYPDTTEPFLMNMENALRSGMSYTLSLWAPLLYMTKTDIVRLGEKLNVPWGLTWSCYAGEEKPCGKCDACIRRARAFKEAGVKDPL